MTEEKEYSYEDCSNFLKKNEDIVIFKEGFEDSFSLPSIFKGKKYTFFGIKKIYKTVQYPNGTSYAALFHRFFIAHLIDPPIDPELEKHGIHRREEHFYSWKRKIYDEDMNYAEYEDYAKRMGFFHIADIYMDNILNKIGAL